MIAKFWPALAGCMLLLPLAIAPGCGGGGSSGSATTFTPPPPVVFEEDDDLSARASFTEEDKIHFLKRTHFGFTPEYLENLNAMGMEAYVDWMLDFQPTPQLEADALAVAVADPDYPNLAEISRWWTYMMVHNPNPFQEVLAMFWHDHFAASSEILQAEARWWMFKHINLWRQEGLNDLPNLLHKMSTDWVMLEWLDGVRSTAGRPNENFAREFWELFTLGVDVGYTEADIQEAARSFTGFRTRLEPDRAGVGRDQLIVEWVPARHDNTAKTIFGVVVPGNGEAEYMDIVQLTLAERTVAEFICRKIWEGFASEEPSALLMSNMAHRFRQSNYDIKDLFRTIFLSRAFYGPKAKKGLVKGPVDHTIGFMRATGLELTPPRIDTALVRIGQRPSMPPTVNGWPGESFWLSSQGLLERANMLRDSILYRNEAPQTGFDVGTLIDPVAVTDTEVVAQLAWRLQVNLNQDQFDSMVDYLNTDRTGAGAIVAQPWDINDPVQREKKLRGLLYILGQHPDFALR